MVEEAVVTFPRDAGRRVLQELDKRMKITGAFWRYAEDAREWRLFLVIPETDKQGVRVFYRQIGEVLDEMPAEERGEVDIWKIYLLGPDSNLAKTMHQFHRSVSEPPFGRYEQADLIDRRPYVYR